MNGKEKVIRWFAAILACICLGTAAYSAVYIWGQCREYEKGSEVYEKIAEAVVIPNPEDPEETPDPSLSEMSETESEEAGEKSEPILEIDFAALQESNPEIIAWLYCPDTEINYPVAQGTDNSYYLTHLADGTYNRNGCLFVDSQNASDFSDDNTIIYGHHMKSGKMFAGLIKYKSQEYFEQHPVVYLITPEHQYEIRLFAGYTAEVNSDSYYLQLGDSHSLAEWMREVAARSDFKAAVQLTTKDRIVTLSTCAYDFQNARYVVHGKLVEI